MKNFMNVMDLFKRRKNLGLLFFPILLAGCSTMPDVLNPVEWYKGARGIITDTIKGETEPEQQTVGGVGQTNENNSFPKLSSVPARPKVLNSEKRKNITGGLIADNDAARKYSTEIVRRQEETKRNSRTAQTNIGALKVTSSVKKMPKPVIRPEPLPITAAKPKAGLVYMSPPKPIQMVSPNRSSLLKSQNTKQPVRPNGGPTLTPKMKKLPAFNPNPPKIAAIPRLQSHLRQGQTIVISGSGIYSMNSVAEYKRAVHRNPPLRPGVSTMNSSGQVNQDYLRKSYQVAIILFPNGSSRMGVRDRRVLRQVFAEHKKVGGRLRIVGHASRRTATNDPILHKMINFEVSASRAERVAKELMKLGIKANKLSIASVSDSEPRYHEYMPAGEAGNRRTEIFIDF